jgi:hypothetical protein
MRGERIRRDCLSQRRSRDRRVAWPQRLAVSKTATLNCQIRLLPEVVPGRSPVLAQIELALPNVHMCVRAVSRFRACEEWGSRFRWERASGTGEPDNTCRAASVNSVDSACGLTGAPVPLKPIAEATHWTALILQKIRGGLAV